MSQLPEAPSPKPEPARGSGPPSKPLPAKEGIGVGARVGRSAKRSRGESRGGGGRSGGEGRLTKPTPVRALVGDDSDAPEPDVHERTLSVGVADWTVRILGRSLGAQGSGTAPLLLLGFTPSGPSPPPRVVEAWVVGRALAELTPEQLEAALQRAAPPPDPDRSKGFFAEATDRRRR